MWAAEEVAPSLEKLDPYSSENIRAPQDFAEGRSMGDIPDVYIKEAMAFHSKCMNSHQKRAYYDCRCLAVQYLDERVKRGPDADSQEIVMSIGSGCEDGTGATGQMYTECITNGAMVPPETDMDTYCECLASTYGQLYETSKLAMNSRTYVRLKTQAKVMCTNPELARKYYPALPKSYAK